MKKMLFAMAFLGLALTGLLASFTDGNIIVKPDPGIQKWAHSTGLSISNPVFSRKGKYVYVEGFSLNNYKSYLYAFKTSNGKLKWKREIPSGCNFISIDKKGIIYGGANEVGGGCFYAINSFNGRLKWRFKTVGNAPFTSPAFAKNGTIYFADSANQADDDAYLYALRSNGSLKWKYKIAVASKAIAIGKDGTIYFGAGSDLYALTSNGKFKWKFNTGSTIGGASPAIGRDGTIYIGTLRTLGPKGMLSQMPYLCAVNPDGTKKWKYQVSNSITSAPIIGHDGTIYFDTDIPGSSDSYLYALRPDGSLKWNYKLPVASSASPLIGDNGTIYVSCDNLPTLNGKLVAIDSNGREKWNIQFGGNPLSPTIGPDGTVYLACLNYNTDAWLRAIYTDAKGLDLSAPWPKFQKDVNNSGNVRY